MKFGEVFMEYLHGDQEGFLDKYAHVEYKRLKKVLKSCRTCQALQSEQQQQEQEEGDQEKTQLSEFYQCQSCPCKFFFILKSLTFWVSLLLIAFKRSLFFCNLWLNLNGVM